MTLPLNPLHLAIALRPYVQTEPSALAFWFMINLASLAFEFNQWTQRRIEATNTDNGSFRLLLVGAAAGLAWLVPFATLGGGTGAVGDAVVAHPAESDESRKRTAVGGACCLWFMARPRPRDGAGGGKL